MLCHCRSCQTQERWQTTSQIGLRISAAINGISNPLGLIDECKERFLALSGVSCEGSDVQLPPWHVRLTSGQAYVVCASSTA